MLQDHRRIGCEVFDQRRPFTFKLDEDGVVKPYAKKFEWRLSDLKPFFYDKKLVERMLSRGSDPLIYETYWPSWETVEGVIGTGTEIIHPGKIGDEYYHSRGHFHEKAINSEFYVGVKGHGRMLLQSPEGEVVVISMEPNEIAYMPPGWGHRAVNVGRERMCCQFVWLLDSGHNYQVIEEGGFLKLLLERDGKPTLVDNPLHGK